MERANVLLLMSDQHRADCLGMRGHPTLETPTLDSLAKSGADFTSAYSATALCAPARRTLLTGQSASRHGVLDENAQKPLTGATLAGLLGQQGYQTHLVGKLHLWPPRNFHGFQSADWADWIDPRNDNDYTAFMRAQSRGRPWIVGQHAFDQNSRRACPWALEEHLHFSNWCSDSAVSFLRARDKRRPFFLMASFIPPHPPLFPLRELLEKYLARETPAPAIGRWSAFLAEPAADAVPLAWHGRLNPEAMHAFRAAYYASIEHIDTLIAPILDRVPANTLILYLSDHGDMLGDHYLFRKRAPYEGATRIPLIIKLPESARAARVSIDTAVELMDIVPTVLDYLGLPLPETVDGVSLLPLVLRSGSIERQFIHGENSRLPPLGSGMQFVTDGKWKFVWYPSLGREQLFHLEKDPEELTDLAEDARHVGRLGELRAQLVRALNGRAEGFTDGVQLLKQRVAESPRQSARKPAVRWE